MEISRVLLCSQVYPILFKHSNMNLMPWRSYVKLNVISSISIHQFHLQFLERILHICIEGFTEMEIHFQLHECTSPDTDFWSLHRYFLLINSFQEILCFKKKNASWAERRMSTKLFILFKQDPEYFIGHCSYKEQLNQGFWGIVASVMRSIGAPLRY